jgi:glucarate dehydratase
MVAKYGFKSLKLKGGVLQPELEIATVRALHAAFPNHALRIDPNTGWSVATSLRVAAELDGMLEYLEDPTPGLSGMAEVARQVGIPLATNMCVTGFEHLPEAIEKRSVRIVLSDHHFWGGLRASQRLSGICETWGLELSMHSNSHLGVSLAAMTHLGAVLPTIAYACDTHRPWQVEDVVCGDPLPIVDGAITVPNLPGLGVELDHDALARLHERWLASDVRVRDDEAAMRAVDPTWAPELPRF